MNFYSIIVAMFFAATPSHSEVNAVVTNGETSFAEGVLSGYYVQYNGTNVCQNPFVIGRYISCKDHVTTNGTVYAATLFDQVWVDTNGTMGGMIVVGPKGRVLCQDPMAWNKFRGPRSFVVCENTPENLESGSGSQQN